MNDIIAKIKEILKFSPCIFGHSWLGVGDTFLYEHFNGLSVVQLELTKWRKCKNCGREEACLSHIGRTGLHWYSKEEYIEEYTEYFKTLPSEEHIKDCFNISKDAKVRDEYSKAFGFYGSISISSKPIGTRINEYFIKRGKRRIERK